MIRIYRNNEEGTAVVEHVEMTRAELDAALSVARQEGAASARLHAEEREPAKLRMARFEGSAEAFRRAAEELRRFVTFEQSPGARAFAAWCDQCADADRQSIEIESYWTQSKAPRSPDQAATLRAYQHIARTALQQAEGMGRAKRNALKDFATWCEKQAKMAGGES